MAANNLNQNKSKGPPHVYLDIAATGKTNREIALKLAEKGFPVFPCHATDVFDAQGNVLYKAKSPYINGAAYNATTDKRKIEGWYKKWSDALPGLPTGEVTGLWVIDPDAPTESRADGLGGLAALTVKHGDLVTYTIRTPGGGRHHYFEWEPGLNNSPGQLPPGIEVRSTGLYVIAPGTWLPDGRQWQVERDWPVAPIPAWLRGAVAPREHFDAGVGIDPRIGETPPGLRELASLCERLARSPTSNRKQHEDLYWISAAAGNLVGAGDVLHETAETQLLVAGRQMVNLKPREPWTEPQLRRVIKNGLKDGRAKPRHADRTNEEWWAEQHAAAIAGLEFMLTQPFDDDYTLEQAQAALAKLRGEPPRAASASAKATDDTIKEDAPPGDKEPASEPPPQGQEQGPTTATTEEPARWR